MNYQRLAQSQFDLTGSTMRSPFTTPGWGRIAPGRGVGALGVTDIATGVQDWSEEFIFNPTGVQTPDSSDFVNSDFWVIGWKTTEINIRTVADALSVAEAFAKAAGKNKAYVSVLGLVVSPGEGSSQLIEIVWDWSQWQYNRPGKDWRLAIVNDAMGMLGKTPSVQSTSLLRVTGDRWRKWTGASGIAPMFVSMRGDPSFAYPTKAGVDPNPEQLLKGACVACSAEPSPLPKKPTGGQTDGGPGDRKGPDPAQQLQMLNYGIVATVAVATFLALRMKGYK